MQTDSRCKPNLDKETQDISLNLLIASIPGRFVSSLCDSTQDTPFCSHYAGDLSSEQLYFLGVRFIPLLFPLGRCRDEELFGIFMYHSTFWSCRKIERTYSHPRAHTQPCQTHKNIHTHTLFSLCCSFVWYELRVLSNWHLSLATQQSVSGE